MNQSELMEDSDRLPYPYHLHKPRIHLSTIDFPHSKPILQATAAFEPVPSVLCVSYIPSLSPTPEIIYNGCRQGGIWKPPGDIPIPAKGRSRLCKLEIMVAYIELREMLSIIDPDKWP